MTNGDTVNIGSVAGSLDDFEQQVVTVQAGSSTNAVVNIRDQATTSSNTYTYSSSRVTRGDTPSTVVTVDTNSGVAPPTLSTGTGNDVIVVHSALPSGIPSINAGAGNDTITVAPNFGNLETFSSGLMVSGGGGSGDVVILDDTGDADPNTYTLSGSTVGRSAFGGVTLDAGVETVRLLAGSGANTFAFAPTTYRVDIVGNANADTLIFPGGGSLPGSTFDGGGGINTLDYSAYTTPVTVNLATGLATDLGLVTNVSTVIGGSDDDTLTGGPGIDTISGGPGGDTITGGPGADILNGDADNDTFVWSEGDGTDTMAGGSGTTDIFQVVGSDAAADVIVIAASGADISIARAAPAAFTQQAGPTQGIEWVTVETGSGADQVSVQSLPTGTTLLVDGGADDDAFTLDSNGAAAGGTVKNILGQVVMSGGNTSTNSLTIVDTDSAADSVATITSNTVGDASGDSLFGAGGRLNYSGIGSLNVTFGGGNDTAKITPSVSTAYTIVGGPQPAADTIDISQTGATSPALTGSAASGQFTAANRQPVTFSQFETPLVDGASANGVLRFASATFSVDEAAGAAVVTVQRTDGTLGNVSVQVATSNGTATEPADYAAVQEIVSFGPGETSKTFNVPIVQDTVGESAETVNLTLSKPSGGATLGTQAGAVLTIANSGATAACTPRPRVLTQAVPGGNRLQVRVEATPLGTGQNNQMTQLRFGQLDNARVTLNNQQVTAGQTVTLPRARSRPTSRWSG